MKRMIFAGFIMLVLALMVSVSYAEMKKIPLSKDNLADLKGKWTGSRNVPGRMGLDTDLEISSDSLPIDGKLTFYRVRKKGRGASNEETQIHNIKAKINDQGNLYFKGSNSEMELSLYDDDGKMKLEGKFYWSGANGEMWLKKK